MGEDEVANCMHDSRVFTCLRLSQSWDLKSAWFISIYKKRLGRVRVGEGRVKSNVGANE